MAASDFEDVVHAHYANLYWFALSLTANESDARDLTQQTFLIWATHGSQLRDRSKARSWLITTMHREFIRQRKREQRFPHVELASVDNELPSLTPECVEQIDAATVMETLMTLDEVYRAPLLLFYFEEYSYDEIADVLSVPLGTVMSRLARGKDRIRHALADEAATTESKAGSAASILGQDKHG